jgi:hypothetical protein
MSLPGMNLSVEERSCWIWRRRGFANDMFIDKKYAGFSQRGFRNVQETFFKAKAEIQTGGID